MALIGDEFLAQLLETFREEAREHLSAIASGLLLLEQNTITPDVYQETIELVFRETHSLKGAARAVGLRDIETLCQQQESVFSAIRKGIITLNPDSFDLFHSVIKALERLLADEKGVKTDDLIRQLRTIVSEGAEKETTTPSSPPVSYPIKQEVPDKEPQSELIASSPSVVVHHESGEPHPAVPGTDQKELVPGTDTSVSSPPVIPEPAAGKGQNSSPPAKGGTMIKISSDRLENLFARSDDLMGARLAAGQRSSNLRDLLQNFMGWRWAWSQITTDIEHLRSGLESGNVQVTASVSPEVERIISFLEYNRAYIKTIEGELTNISQAATRDQYFLDTATTELIDEIKRVILVPASSLLEMYPRAARDLARESGKDVDVVISGADIEIDRRILDSIRDPILHIIRNSIDHGIESAEIRQAKGKSPRGQIRISVGHVRGHQVEIRISDDGGGIDTGAIVASAVAKGLITADEGDRMEPALINRLIFKSGLSTRKTVSTVSGRGLGLAIVLEKVEQIGGTVQVDTSGQGAGFIITLPLTLATFRGIRVYANNLPYFLPLRSIERVMQIRREDIKTIENRSVVELEDEPVAVVSLVRAIGLSEESGNGHDSRQLVIVTASGIRFGLLVDWISGVQEIVVKDLGRQLRKVRNISGATILGDGVVVPVINCEDLAATISGMEHVPLPAPAKSGKERQQSILVVEDSITSRMLLKNILEGAGYLVETSVDGMDALTKLNLTPFDIVVSDVDMPRMNGFLLTEKIRSDPSLAEIPVILVTSLDSREDREHGITVGASAYIVKSSFDQSNLLEIISRHIL